MKNGLVFEGKLRLGGAIEAAQILFNLEGTDS